MQQPCREYREGGEGIPWQFGHSIDFDGLHHEKRYNSFGAYAQAKFATMLFTYELARRLEGTGVTVNAITPGPVATNLAGVAIAS
jgi:NAD(P)-dependent dehydrogenase (short-subunit alcohol dehydrogenase family)